MKTTTLILVAAAALATGCAHANFEARPGDYYVEGRSHNPEAMAATLSTNYTRETNAHTYREAVRSGRAWPYSGGGYGNDYWLYFRRYVPTAPAVPGVPPGTESSTSGVTRGELDAVHEEAAEARRRADDSLRMHGRTRRYLEERDGSAPR
jgi:hypothetical protein